MSEGIQRQIWRVRGRPGRPLRRGRSSSRTSRLTAIRTVALRVGSPAMVSYLSCRKWYRAHQWNSSASWILLVGVGLNPRYWIAFRRRHERRDPQPFSGSTGAHCRWSRMAGDRCHQRTVRCMVRVIHGFSSCHRVAQASMSGRIWYSKSARGDSTRSLRSAIVCNSSMIAGTYSRTRRRTWLRKSARDQGNTGSSFLMAGSRCGRHVHVIGAPLPNMTRNQSLVGVPSERARMAPAWALIVCV